MSARDDQPPGDGTGSPEIGQGDAAEVRIVVVMGVAGAGKTTVGSRLAAELGWSFQEGDAFHPEENVRKMRAGGPLDDADRHPWLDRLRALIEGFLARGERAVLACSALRASYRRHLAQGLPGVRFVYLAGDPELLAARLARREGHFMKAGMLASQLATLEEPRGALRVDAGDLPEAIVRRIREGLGV